ncbi:MAG: helix-turn-helix transcriptional regulator [Clostridia bacterium]|nr:helix-turn-helix transcriptional regulator [Clostridia bacterium]
MKEPTLKTLREQNNKTCAEVAQALNVTVQAVYRYEQGKRRISLEHVLILAELFDVSAEEIIRLQLNNCQSIL